MGANPSYFKGDELPAEQINWEDAKEFCRKLNTELSLSEAEGYRLLSEAEWEYATRAGTRTEFAFGDTISPEIVNYDGNYPYGNAPKGIYRQKTVPVGSLGAANAWGLFDMYGNVWEWCGNTYPAGYLTRVGRGGSWNFVAGPNPFSEVGMNSPAYRNRSSEYGFRLARTVQ
jgi:eukaryotic-like serine/threonine-protein kinase